MAVAKCFARIISLFRSGWAIWGSMQNWILAKDASQVKIKIDCLTLFFVEKRSQVQKGMYVLQCVQHVPHVLRHYLLLHSSC